MTQQCTSISSSGHRPLSPDGHVAALAPCDAPCAERSRPFVLAATTLASAMAFIDGSVITIALPAIQSDLQAGFAAVQWVINAYALLLGGLILIGGGSGDRFGRRKVFVIGIAVFVIASIGCAIASSVEALVAARALKGLGAALLVPQSLAIIAASFPEDVRGKAIGIWAGASALTTALGPALGGILIDSFGWRSIFWINVPLSAVCLYLTLRHVPESKDNSATSKLDWRGGLLSILAFGLITIGLTRFAESPGEATIAAILSVIGLGTLVLFVYVEKYADGPLMPLSLFRDRAFAGANLMTLFLYGALTGVLFLLPFELIERRGMTATEVGLTLLPLGLIIGVLSRQAGAFADRLGARSMLIVGCVIVAIATAGFGVSFGGFWTSVFAPIVLLAVGMAIVVAPLTTVVMNSAPESLSGAASGVNNAASRLAGLFAVALLGAIASLIFSNAVADTGTADLRFGTLPDANDPMRALLENAFVRSYTAAMWITCLWSLIAAGLSATLPHDSKMHRLYIHISHCFKEALKIAQPSNFRKPSER